MKMSLKKYGKNIKKQKARINKMEWENKKPFIEIKINGSDLYELDIIDLKNAQYQIQKYLNELENETVPYNDILEANKEDK